MKKKGRNRRKKEEKGLGRKTGQKKREKGPGGSLTEDGERAGGFSFFFSCSSFSRASPGLDPPQVICIDKSTF